MAQRWKDQMARAVQEATSLAESTERAALTVVIPAYGGANVIGTCLESVTRECQRLTEPAEIIVVDNASTDRTLELVRESFPDVSIISLARNLGFAAACAIGIRRGSGRHVLLMNQDAWLTEGSLQSLLEFARDGDYAIAGPLILNPDGTAQTSQLGIDFLGEPSPAAVNWGPFYLSGSVLLLRRQDYLELGGFDTRFFAYFEECDLQWRAHLMGKRVGWTREATAFHIGDQPEPTGLHRPRLDRNSWRRQYLGRRNQLTMLLKNYSLASLVWVLPTWCLSAVAECVGDLIFGSRQQFSVYLASIWWNLRELPRTLELRRSIQASRQVRDREVRRGFGRPFRRLYLGIEHARDSRRNPVEIVP